MENFNTKSNMAKQLLFDMGLVLLECFLGEDKSLFQSIDVRQFKGLYDQQHLQGRGDVAERALRKIKSIGQHQHQQFCCLLHTMQSIQREGTTSFSWELKEIREQLQGLFTPPVFQYLLLRLDTMDPLLLDFLCCCFNQKENYHRVLEAIESHPFLSRSGPGLNSRYGNSANPIMELALVSLHRVFREESVDSSQVTKRIRNQVHLIFSENRQRLALSTLNKFNIF